MLADESRLGWITGEMIRREILKRWDKLSQLGDSRVAYKLTVVRQRQTKNGYSDTPSGRGLALREFLKELLNEIKPASSDPNFNEKPWRMYSIIAEQYIEGRTTDVVIGKLGVSKSTYYREQIDACELLAEKIRQAEIRLISAMANKRVLSPSPLPLTNNLIGRDHLLSEIKQSLSKDALVALVGLPGVGKTALAISIMYDADIQKKFTDGIHWARPGRN